MHSIVTNRENIMLNKIIRLSHKDGIFRVVECERRVGAISTKEIYVKVVKIANIDGSKPHVTKFNNWMHENLTIPVDCDWMTKWLDAQEKEYNDARQRMKIIRATM